MQTLASHWDTTGNHLAPPACADNLCVIDFADWWHDDRAQQIATALIACGNEIGVGDPLATADADLAAIYNNYASQLRYSDADWGYIDDLIYDTPTAESVACDPWKYQLVAGAA